MNLFIFEVFLVNIFLHAYACNHASFPSDARTTQMDGTAFGAPIIQKRTTDNFTAQDSLHYDYDNNRLILVDRFGPTIILYHPTMGTIDTCHIQNLDDQELAFAIPVQGKENNYIVAANNTIYSLKLNSCKEQISCIYDLQEIIKLPTQPKEIISQGVVDANGNILVGTKPDDHHIHDMDVKVYRINLKTKEINVLNGTYRFTTGIVFDRNNEYLYVADPVENLVYHSKYNAQTGEASNKTVIFNIEDFKETYYGKATGLAVDTDGKLFIAVIEARMIFHFDPSANKILQVADIPVTVTNSIALGESGDLYLGSGHQYVLDKIQEPQAGALYGIIGFPAKGFRPNSLIY